MPVQVVGAGLGRTGTTSLKLALEQVLGGPCYHMIEVFGHPDDVGVWKRAFEGDEPDWRAFLADYQAAVDWPVVSFWRELSDAFPDALVILSVRDTDAWWASASETIFDVMRQGAPPEPEMQEWWQMAQLMMNRFTPDWTDRAAATAAYERHNDTVRATAPVDRFLEWRAGDGWAPICAALGLPVPDEPFPHVNTSAEFQEMRRGAHD